MNVRFRLRDGRAVHLLYVSDLTVNPDNWNPKKEEIKAKILMHPADKAKFNKLVAERKAQITDMYNAAPDKSILTSAWLKAEMKKIVSPDEPEVRPIYEVMSSHSARRAFSGNMYDKIQDPNLICALTGHKEGSKSFARYRKIDEDTNRKTISLLE